MEIQQTFRVFSAADVRAALPMRKAVEVMREAFHDVSSGEVTAPLRTHMRLASHHADVLVMPSHTPRLDRVGAKVISLHPGNAERGLPFIQATMMVLDAANGRPLALMNGSALTAIRTGASCGVATDILARPDASQVGIIGSGPQAAAQLEAMCAVRPIRLAMVYDRDPDRAAAFAAKMSKKLGIDVERVASTRAAVASADIVCCATTSKTPVFKDGDISPGTHINAIGSYKPTEREIPPETVARALVVVDQTEAAWEEAGDLIMARDEGAIETSHLHAELGEILMGRKCGRTDPEQITFFKSVGVAAQDLAAAHAVLTRGTKLELGSAVSL